MSCAKLLLNTFENQNEKYNIKQCYFTRKNFVSFLIIFYEKQTNNFLKSFKRHEKTKYIYYHFSICYDIHQILLFSIALF